MDNVKYAVDPNRPVEVFGETGILVRAMIGPIDPRTMGQLA